MLQDSARLLREERSRGLTVNDLKLTRLSAVELGSSTAVMRMALYEVCEIMRLCEGFGTEGRAAVEKVRDKLQEVTKAEHNLLPHEETKKIGNILKKDQSKLLPKYRYDNA